QPSSRPAERARPKSDRGDLQFGFSERHVPHVFTSFSLVSSYWTSLRIGDRPMASPSALGVAPALDLGAYSSRHLAAERHNLADVGDSRPQDEGVETQLGGPARQHSYPFVGAAHDAAARRRCDPDAAGE